MLNPASASKTFFQIIWGGALAGLGWAVEFAVLELIADSSTTLKIATAIIGTLAIATIVFRFWLNQSRMFWTLLSALSIIYCCFLTYAIVQAFQRDARRHHLAEMYVAAGPILEREIQIVGPANALKYDEVAIKKFQTDAKNWETSTQNWLLANLGSAARGRFLDMSNVQTICWGPVVACDNRYDISKNILNAEKKNLSAIMETTAYGQ